ncbi:MAG: PilZ domain-containing protein [Terriglobales bacterium]
MPRYQASFPVTVRHRPEHDLEGHSITLSEGGISVTLPEPIPVGSVVLLQFTVPTHSAKLRLWAVVRHLIGLQHGLEFVSVTEGERLSLRQFCNELALQSGSGAQAGSGEISS